MDIVNNIDQQTNTFAADRVFCDALFASKNADPVAEMFVYFAWVRMFFPHFQEGLIHLVPSHFPQDTHEKARYWTFALLSGIMNDISLIPYFVIRGVFGEAGGALRRALEHIGILAHMWADTAKVRFVEDFDSKNYVGAFLSERNKKAQEDLKARGVKKRFAALSLAMPASRLYELLSDFYVHGGSSTYLIHSALEPNQFSCWFHNRVDPEKENTEFFTRGIEMLCVEIVNLYSEHANKYDFSSSRATIGCAKLNEVYSFPDPPTDEKRRQMKLILEGLRNRQPEQRAKSGDFEEWLLEKGLTKGRMTSETVLTFFRDVGIEVTEDGIPLIPGTDSGAQPCSRCGAWAERGVQGTSNGGRIVICQECYKILFTDTDRFHTQGWGKPLSEDEGKV